MAVRDSVSTTDEETPGWGAPLVAVYQRRYVAFVRLAYVITGSRDASQDIVQDSFVAANRSWDRVRADEPADAPAPDELWGALDSLNPRQSAAIVLRFYADLADDDIGRLLGCRPATVGTSIHRALRRLREEIAR